LKSPAIAVSLGVLHVPYIKLLTVTSESASTSTVNLVVHFLSSCFTILTTASSNLVKNSLLRVFVLTVTPLNEIVPAFSSSRITLTVTASFIV
jgi:hypothetical protein